MFKSRNNFKGASKSNDLKDFKQSRVAKNPIQSQIIFMSFKVKCLKGPRLKDLKLTVLFKNTTSRSSIFEFFFHRPTLGIHHRAFIFIKFRTEARRDLKPHFRFKSDKPFKTFPSEAPERSLSIFAKFFHLLLLFPALIES